MVTLSTLPINANGIIRVINLDTPTCHRLLELGLFKGVKVRVKSYAPLGSPIEIQIKGQSSTIALRKEDASNVLVVPI